MAENVGVDLLQKVIGSCVDKLPAMHKEATGENISKEQLEFITAMSSSLADMVVTAIRAGTLKPIDIADLILKRTATTVGITAGNSAGARGTTIIFALASFALTSALTHSVDSHAPAGMRIWPHGPDSLHPPQFRR